MSAAAVAVVPCRWCSPSSSVVVVAAAGYVVVAAGRGKGAGIRITCPSITSCCYRNAGNNGKNIELQQL